MYKAIDSKVNLKLFKELNDGDFIYYINPFVQLQNPKTPLEDLLKPTFDSKNQLIQACKVKSVTGIPSTGDIMKDIQYKNWIRITYFRPEPILHSENLEMIPTVILDFNGTRNFAFTLVSLEDKAVKFPVPYCTDRGYLTQYVKSTYGQGQ